MYFLKLTYIWLNYYQIHIVVYKTNLHVHIAWLSKGIQHSAGPLITSLIILPLKSELHELNTVYKNISYPFYSHSLDGSLHVVKIKQNHYTEVFVKTVCCFIKIINFSIPFISIHHVFFSIKLSHYRLTLKWTRILFAVDTQYMYHH